MATRSIYRYMGATIERISSGAWVAHRLLDALHTLKGWQELPDGNWRDLDDAHCFEFADNLAAERCISHFAWAAPAWRNQAA